MKRKNLKKLSGNYIVLVFLSLLIVLLSFFYFIIPKNYGSEILCGKIGGIWCYWPNWTNVLGYVLIFAIFILIIFISIKFTVNYRKKR